MVTEEQAAGVADHRPMESTIPGVPITVQQGLRGEVPPLEPNAGMPAIVGRVADPRRAPNATPPAEHGKGAGMDNTADYRMLGVQMQRRQTLIQEVEFRYAAPVVGPTAPPPTVEHLHNLDL